MLVFLLSLKTRAMKFAARWNGTLGRNIRRCIRDSASHTHLGSGHVKSVQKCAALPKRQVLSRLLLLDATVFIQDLIDHL